MMSKRVLPVFSSRHFMVWGLTFKSLIHFEFIFLHGMRKQSILIHLHVVIKFSQHHLFKTPSHHIFFPAMLQINCTCKCELFLLICWLYTPHIDGVIQYLSFYNRLVSLSTMRARFTPVAACVRVAFLFKAEQYSVVCINHILFVRPSIDRHLGCFNILAITKTLLGEQVY